MTADSTFTPPPAPPTPPAAPPPVEPARKGALQRFGGVIVSPGDTFQDIVRRPDILVPLIVILVLSFISTAVVVPRIDFETAMREQMREAQPDLAAEDLERVVRFSTAFAKVFAYASPIFVLLIFAIIAGILLLCFRLFGGEGNFKQAFSITLYAWVPQLIKGIVGTFIAMARKEIPAEQLDGLVRSNLGFLAGMKEQPVLHALLTSLDIFNIWTLVLFIIGFSVMSRLSRAKSAAIIVSLWLLTVLAKAGFAALGAARAKA